MNWKWKRRGLISLTTVFAMLYPAVAAAAEIGPAGSDVPPAVTADAGSEAEEDGLLEASDEEVDADPENSGEDPSAELVPDMCGHRWSADWSYDDGCHWHECEAEECPVADNREKDGYGEHSYGDDGICTECGYVKQDGLRARAAGVVPTYQEAYEAMIALKEKYPEGMEWTNFTPYGSNGTLGDSYLWKGGKIFGASRGVGCAAFAFVLSDEAFDSLPARVAVAGSFTFEDVKVGDILRINGNSHSVIVLQKSVGGVIIAEGNYNKSVHWGRVMTEAEVLAASYIITRYPVGYEPDDEEDIVVQAGTAGNLSWSLTGGGVLTVSGNGAIPDYSSGNLPPWSGYNVRTIVIEKGVTSIGDYAFYECSALSIYIPDGIVKIGQNAFYNSALISVTIPGTVGAIEDSAFRNCGNLTSVTVPEGVKTIGDEAFRGCTSLGYIDFPASITSVGTGAFMSCKEMTRVRFKPGRQAVTLGDNLFSQCQRLTSVTLPQTADRISAGMFQSCTTLPEVYIPASVKEIGENPFTSCKYLEYIYFGGSEAEWKGISNPALEASLKSTGTTVIFNAAFDDPFAADPDDPGDLLPDEGEDGEDPANPDEGGSDHEHNWSGQWSYNETYHWHECGAGCFITSNSDKAGYGEHSYGGWVVDVRATAAQSGSRHRDCTVCGYRQTGSIPAAGTSGESNGSSGSFGSASLSGPARAGGINTRGSITNRSALQSSLFVSEKTSGRERGTADTGNLTPTDRKEAETDLDKLSESNKKVIREAAEKEAKKENISGSDRSGAGIIVPVLVISAAAALAGAFVLLRKKE